MVSFSLLNAIDPTTIIFMVLLAVLIIALLVVPMFTNKKRAKQTEELHSSLKPGDLIKTIGGVVGTIIEIRQISPVDKEMVIETGVGENKTTMVFDIQALYQVMSRSSTIVPAREEPDEQPAEAEAEQAPEQPAREVPEILADRQAKAEQEQSAEQASASEPEQKTEPEAETVEQPKEEVEVKEQVAQKEPAAKPAAAKKPSAGNKKSSGGAKKSK